MMRFEVSNKFCDEPAIIFINLNNRPGLARLISEELISSFSSRMG